MPLYTILKPAKLTNMNFGVKRSTVSRAERVSTLGAAAFAIMASAACHAFAPNAEGDEACTGSRIFIHYDYYEGLTRKKFSLRIDQAGDAEFNGEHIAQPGRHHVKLSRSAIDGLIAEIQASGLFEMKGWYGPPPNDGGSTDLNICLRGRSKQITYVPEATAFDRTPDMLIRLDQAILTSTGARQWIGNR